MIKTIKNTAYLSRTLGILPKGCQMCVKGEKLVLFITTICPRTCWFCPLSDKRKNGDKVFVNEWQTNSKDDLISEVELCQSKGAGITGGDPLSVLSRTTSYIKFLKEKKGKSFHIHLYTSFNLVNEKSMKELYEAGLDEIRFHADLDDDKLWKNIDFATKFDWDVGIEIPMIPTKVEQIKKLCDEMSSKIKFMNLNEFEISDTNSEKMYENDMHEKSDISHGIIGSLDAGEEILNYVRDNYNFNVHMCSSSLKDKIQMQNRFKLRAESIKTEFDIVTDEGLLVRGCIYLKNQEKNLEKLKEKKIFLEDEGLELFLDEKKFRLLSYPEHVEQFSEVLKSLDLIPVIIEEDPTVEAFEVNRDYL